MKSKKVFLVLERKALKMLSYVNDELYKELYPRYLRKIGINIPEDYREGKKWLYRSKCIFWRKWLPLDFNRKKYHNFSRRGCSYARFLDCERLASNWTRSNRSFSETCENWWKLLYRRKMFDFARNRNRRQYYLRGQCCTVKYHRTVL